MEITVVSRFIHLLEQANGSYPNLFRVLTYHRIDEPEADPTAYHRVTVAPRVFEQQMQFLADNYHVLSILELLEADKKSTSLPPRSVLVTFDDAYKDFASKAWPILKKYQLPVTLFVPTAYPGHPERSFWWDRVHRAIFENQNQSELITEFGSIPIESITQKKKAFSRTREIVKSLPHDQAMAWVDEICTTLEVSLQENNVLGWDELRRLVQEGVILGPHTRNHPMMDQIPLNVAKAEIVGAINDLERQIGSVLPIFAYPGGRYTNEAESILRESGIEIAFSTKHGINDGSNSDWMRLRRINVGPRTSLPIFRAQLLSWWRYLS